MPKPKCPLHRVLHFSASHETRSIAYRISLLSDVPLPPKIIPASLPPARAAVPCPCRAPDQADPGHRFPVPDPVPRSRLDPVHAQARHSFIFQAASQLKSSTDIIHPESGRRPTIPLLTFDPASSIIIIILILSRSAGALAAQNTQTKEGVRVLTQAGGNKTAHLIRPDRPLALGFGLHDLRFFLFSVSLAREMPRPTGSALRAVLGRVRLPVLDSFHKARRLDLNALSAANDFDRRAMWLRGLLGFKSAWVGR